MVTGNYLVTIYVFIVNLVPVPIDGLFSHAEVSSRTERILYKIEFPKNPKNEALLDLRRRLR